MKKALHNHENKESKPVGCLKIGLWIVGGILIFSSIIGIAFSIFGPNAEEIEAMREETTAKIEAKRKEQISKDSIAEVKRLENLPDDLRKTIEDIKNVEFNKFRGSLADLQLELILFNEWRKIIEESDKMSQKGTEESRQLAEKLKKTVQNIQSKEFPILRKEYVKEAKKIMWEHDIDVSGSSNNRTINFTGGIFAANKNIKEFQENTHTILKNFRFRQANYRWYKGASEFTYYKIYEEKDTDLVYLK